MSTIIASNVSDGTRSIPTTFVTNGSAKAWLNLNGTGTIAVRDSLNISSVSDNGTGDYTVNFSSAFGAADYAAYAQGSGNNDTISLTIREGTTPTSSSFRPFFVNTAVTLGVDSLYVFSAVHGDLA
jgi:hypothetical protein